VKNRQGIISNEKIKLFMIAIPFLIYFIAFFYVPLFGWLYAFFDYKPGLSLNQMKFEGVSNFLQIFVEWSETMRVLKNTLAMSFLGILSQPLPIIFAILLNELRGKRFSKLVQIISTLPNFISWIIIFAMSFSIFSVEGLLNTVLGKLHLPLYELSILGNNDAVWYFQWGLGIWKSLGWSSIIYLAAIVGIDQEQYEAAEIDGAGRFKKILHITLPGVVPTFLVLFLLNISNILNLGFEQYYVFFNPMVAHNIENLDYYVYKLGIITHDYSFAIAVGILKSFVSVLLLFMVNGISKKLRGGNAIL
jgi:putative aldouronate transport system permease protein